MDQAIPWAFLSALNPTLLAATTVMLMLPHPKRLLLGYLAGAALTSITLGTIIATSLQGSSLESTTRHTLSPAANLALGALALLIAYLLRPVEDKGRGRRRPSRRSKPKEGGPPRWQRGIQRGSARATFVVGALLTLPGGSYLIGLDHIASQGGGTAATLLMVIGFNLIMLALLEVPLIGYALAPDRTPQAVDRFRSWLTANGRRIAVRGAAVVGALLIARGLIELLT